jgi:hypothetical protein
MSELTGVNDVIIVSHFLKDICKRRRRANPTAFERGFKICVRHGVISQPSVIQQETGSPNSTSTLSAPMAKPTLLQTLLGRPSQTYSFPQEHKKYHSNKSDLLRLARNHDVNDVSLRDMRSDGDSVGDAVGTSSLEKGQSASPAVRPQ